MPLDPNLKPLIDAVVDGSHDIASLRSSHPSVSIVAFVDVANPHLQSLDIQLDGSNSIVLLPISTNSSSEKSPEVKQILAKAIRQALERVPQDSSTRKALEHSNIESSSVSGHWLVVPLNECYLAASILHHWPTPPAVVLKDWRQQLHRSAQAAQSDSQKPSPCTTIASRQGELLDLGSLIAKIKLEIFKITSATITELAPAQVSNPCPIWQHAIPSKWPWPTKSLQRVAEPASSEATELNDVLAAPSGIRKGTGRNSKRSNKQFLWIGASLAAVVLLSATIWMVVDEATSPASNGLSQNQSSASTQTKQPTTISNQSASPSTVAKPLSPDEPSDSVNAMPDEPLTTVDLSSPAANAEPTLAQPSIDSLLSSLKLERPTKPSTSESAVEPSTDISANFIVESSLRPSTPADANTDTTIDDVSNDMPELDEVTTDTPVETKLVKQTIAIRQSLTREQVSMSERITKRASCATNLKLIDAPEKTFVIIAPDPNAIIGPGKSTWRIAIEDESPELVVEITSKPAARWKLTVQVGVRYRADMQPVPLDIHDAQTIGGRLLEYDKWLTQSIESLRNAPRDRKSPIDINGQIRAMQAEQKATQDAIEQWQVISRLSHQLFKSGEIEFELTPK